MAPVSAPAKILVTGASGFIAVWVCKTLLDQGYQVVGTVRSSSKGEYLQNLFEKDGYGKDKFSFVIVEDMEKKGAFDQVVVGVDAVEHTASPFHIQADDPQELIRPALKGTIGILESIKKNAPGIKRVVITSSTASIVHEKASRTFDDTDWNVTSPNEVEQKGKNASQWHKYRASKVLAERAAWEFLKDNKDSIAFDLVTICPPLVWGPIIHEVKSIDALNTSIADFRKYMQPGKTEEDLLAHSGCWVDVRDVALIHALSLSNEKAGGERFLTSSGSFTYQDVLDAIHKVDPSLTDVPIGAPGKGKDVKGVTYVSAKAEKVFNIKFKTLEKTAPATLKALKDRGFWAVKLVADNSP
ncbi:methylglyoxal reductase (NADPH-dependent) gre2 [Tulasnella sp. 330]|nr:methylglyoxal reductase (NADPH-dependent) gre2 [Tulasnella sp. 330]KAG8883912.1 methylglyoxal reductase (NADPH-dependent) gre2 [Tulasnella sp. 331]KAG8889231.1 methylglyoxal reductase (NADPH-dependent) gre2 [Tulasnella sp. 332]